MFVEPIEVIENFDLNRSGTRVTDRHAYLIALPAIGASFRELIGHYAIAMTAVQVSALIEDRAKVEIEATAVVAG